MKYEYRVKVVNPKYGEKDWRVYKSFAWLQIALRDVRWAKGKFGENPQIECREVHDWEPSSVSYVWDPSLESFVGP